MSSNIPETEIDPIELENIITDVNLKQKYIGITWFPQKDDGTFFKPTQEWLEEFSKKIHLLNQSKKTNKISVEKYVFQLEETPITKKPHIHIAIQMND
jgi:hypothetical protein